MWLRTVLPVLSLIVCVVVRQVEIAEGYDEEAAVDETENESDDDSTDVEAADGNAGVMTLTNQNFNDFLQANDKVLVDFYAPWCEHCKSLAPEWEKAAHILNSQGLKIRLAKMDAESESLGAHHAADGYPTIKLFDASNSENGIEVKGMQGEKPTADAIVRYATHKEFSEPNEIGGAYIEKRLSMLQPGQFALVARVKSNSARAKAYWNVPGELVNFTGVAFQLFVEWLPKSADPKSDSSLFMWRPGFVDPDTIRLEYKGAWTTGNIAKWAKRNVYGTVNQFWLPDLWSKDNDDYFEAEVLVAALFDSASLDLKANLQSQLLTFKESNPMSIALLLNCDDLEEIEEFNPKDSPLPLLTVKKGGTFVLAGRDQIAKADSVKRFVADVKSEKARRVLKSAPLPAVSTDSDGVTTLVGDTFYNIVLNPRRDVLVEFWEPDCQGCEELDPIWKQVARTVKEDYYHKVIIAKLNILENEPPEFPKRVPKVILYPAVKAEQKFRKKVEYSGQWSYEKIMHFLESSARNLNKDDEL